LPRYRALIAYDGTDYFGFQRQRDEQPTIQGELERALATLTNSAVSVTGSGRTDRGVHATGQVVSFQILWKHGKESLQHALNANLPSDIAVIQLDEVHEEFHPRFDAQRRAYQYFIYNQSVRSPLHGRFHWHISTPLDMTRMNAAAAELVGLHDYATFGTPPQGESTVREIFHSHWLRQDNVLIYEVEATAYLYRMVRSIVGSLKLVGDGSWTVKEFVAAFQAANRDLCGTVAPPQGLRLVSVKYEDD
jgi:tRNA pseudouridine38-40 synthase